MITSNGGAIQIVEEDVTYCIVNYPFDGNQDPQLACHCVDVVYTQEARKLQFKM